VIDALAKHARGEVIPDLLDILDDWTTRPGFKVLAMRLETLILEAVDEEPDPRPAWETAYRRRRLPSFPALSEDGIDRMSMEEIRAMVVGWEQGLPVRVAAKRARRMEAAGGAT